MPIISDSSNVTTVHLSDWLSQGEGAELEFKAIPQSSSIARNISAFANAKGGTILIGVGPHGEVIGADPSHATNQVERALQQLDPAPRASLQTIATPTGSVVAVNVPPSGVGPVFVDGAVLVRDGARNRPLQKNDLLQALTSKQGGDEPSALSTLSEAVPRLMELLENQSNQLDEQSVEIRNLNSEIVRQNKLRTKLPGFIVSALLGALAREVFTVAHELLGR